MHIITPLPERAYLAISGGIDSMVAYHFLTRCRKRTILPVFFHHGTETSEQAYQFLKANVELHKIGNIATVRSKKQSPEEFFRHERYAFFNAVCVEDIPIITAHHLNDQVETYYMSSLTGKIRRIPYRRGRFIRPFLNARKAEIFQYMWYNNVKYVEDKTNQDNNIPRNRIRNIVIPELEKINPSLYNHHWTFESDIQKCK